MTAESYSIKLSSNENPLGASPLALHASQQALAHAHVYPDHYYRQLTQKLAQFLAVRPEQITLGNGSENILELIIKTYLQPIVTAVISQYAFFTIPLLLQHYGARATVVPAWHFGHDIDAMIQAVNDDTRLLFLVNPNNPTGTYTNKIAFEKMMASLPSRVLVIVDEAYVEYIDKDDYPRMLDYLAHYPNLIIVRTFSKAYGLAGLRIGYAISSLEIAQQLNHARLPFNVNHIAVQAACAALDDQEHIHKTIAHNALGMKQLEAGLAVLKLSYIPSVTNFITIHVGDAQMVYQQLLTQGILIKPLTQEGMPNHIRVTVGTQHQNEFFLAALEKLISFT